MEELGQLLRDARERQGISIEQAQIATRIRARYLEGLENDDYQGMPAPVYVRGFLRTYAQFLGLDAEHVVDQFDRDGRVYESNLQQRQRREPTISTRGWAGPDTRAMALTAVLVVVAIGVVYFFRQYRAFVADNGGVAFASPTVSGVPAVAPTARIVPTTAPPLAVSSVATATAIPSLPTRLPAVPTPLPTTLPTFTPIVSTAVPTAEATATPASGVAITTTISQAAWMRVIVDGQTAWEGTFQPGVSKSWDAKKYITLRIGNAGGVRVTFNGKDQGILGDSGQVVERTWRATATTADVSSGTARPS